MPEKNLEIMRHSASHIMAAAVLKMFPEAKLAIGPAIENGFYYDFDLPRTLIPEDLPLIEEKMKALIKNDCKFERADIPAMDALKEAKKNKQTYKAELIQELIDLGEKTVSFYRVNHFTDLCKGPHVKSTKEIGAFKLTSIAGAYWRGNEKNKMLQRIYGIAFPQQKDLDKYLKEVEEAEKRDHRKLGKELDLFYIDEEVGKGLPMWTPKGTVIKFALEEFTRELEKKYGYEHVSTPYLANEKLYEISGHLSHYQQNMYSPIKMDDEVFYLRPMACPHHIKLLMRKPLSYRDLPVRYAEIADYNRYEKSGELMGMIRARKFQLTDAHIFVSPEGLKEEFKNVCHLIQDGMAGLGLSRVVTYRFSKRGLDNKDKYYPDDSLWEKAEKIMKEALDELKFTYVEAEDEAAFYGPKLDVQARNVNGKEDTLFTAQIDFLLPERFNIEYIDADGDKKRPVMIHRSAIGALERTFAFLIEHYAGAFPLWLAPVQVQLVPVSDKFNDFAKGIAEELEKNSIRVAVDESAESVGRKIRNAELSKIPYMVVMGEKEKKSGLLPIRSYKRGELGDKKLTDLIKQIQKEIIEKS